MGIADFVVLLGKAGKKILGTFINACIRGSLKVF